MTPMTCRWYRRRLGRRDAARGGDDAGARRHVRSCARCQRELGDQELLAVELADLEMREPSSARVWKRIESQLDRGAAAESRRRGAPGRVESALGWALHDSPTWAVGIVAVLALLGLWQARDWAMSRNAGESRLAADAGSRSPAAADPATAGSASRQSSASGALQLAMVPLTLDVGSYVREVAGSTGPDEFWSAYRARDAAAENPYRGLAFEPIVPDRLPHGFRRVDTKLLRDACCETLQVRYESADRWVDVFQCHDDHPIEFGRAIVDRRDVSGVVCTAFDWDSGRVRGRNFLLGELSLVALGNVTDEVLDDIVTDFSGR